jgi:hypothetical protein
MQLDRTSIVIAQRGNDELLDLSLAVVRTYWRKILPLAIVGALPFAVLNLIFLYPATDYVQLEMASRETYEGLRFRYLWMMLCMVFIQAPLAMMGVCYFLGQAVFIEEPSLKQIVGVIGRRLFPVLLILGIFRGALISLLFGGWLFTHPWLFIDSQLILISVFAVISFYLIRCFRPFAPEMMLLERCRLIVKSEASQYEQSYRKRSSWLHTHSADLFGVQVWISIVDLIFIVTMCGGSLFLNGVLIGLWEWGWWMDLIFYPMILWMTVVWDTVIRFLMYLNTRIRLEGWEIQLRLHAESQRLQEAGS